MAIHATLAGIPRIGRNRELKRALENYWRDPATGGLLAATARNTVNSYIGAALKAGIDSVPTIGRSFYDSMRYIGAARSASSPLPECPENGRFQPTGMDQPLLRRRSRYEDATGIRNDQVVRH